MRMLLPAILISATGRWGGLYTEERVTAIRRNATDNPYVKAQRERYVKACEPWIRLSDEELWDMVPGQWLPRCVDVTMTRDPETGEQRRAGCLVCGDKIFSYGNYPYRVDIFGHPWKVQCPSCNQWFPSNDFAAFYRTSRDEAGFFDASRGDRSLLVNSDHPAAD
ncbi:MAG: heparinase, partial [Armatimonadetes bacterium]|nr:heparinase [Armatimonadota bacterium]